MINKPINPYPYNCCVEDNGEWAIEYEIPNNQKIDGRYIQIDDLETGEAVLHTNENLDSPISQVSYAVETQLSEDGNGEYSWSSLYWQTPTQDGDKYSVHGCSDKNQLQVVCQDISSVYPIGYPDSYDVETWFDIEPLVYDYTVSGETVYEPTYSEPREVGSGEIAKNTYMGIMGTFKLESSKIRGYWDNATLDEIGDTNEYCYEGQLTDYYGYECIEFWGGENFGIFNNKVLEIGLGKCIICIYDRDNNFIAAGRILAHTKTLSEWAYGFRKAYIIDNSLFGKVLSSNLNQILIDESTSSTNSGTKRIYDIGRIVLKNIDEVNNTLFLSSGLVKLGDNYHIIKNSSFTDYYYQLDMFPSPNSSGIIDDGEYLGDTISVWDNSKANFNTTPAYYFRTKIPPEISVMGSLDNYYITDIKGDFGINYTSSSCAINYFYLYLFVYDKDNAKWVLQEKSPAYYNIKDTHTFVGFVNGQKYRVRGVCVDNDGDEWTTADITFDCLHYPYLSQKAFADLYGVVTRFNSKSTTIDISLSSIIASYSDVSDIKVEFYKVIQNDTSAVDYITYAGGGLCKTGGVLIFDCWHDYNIKNDAVYDYYMRLTFTESDVENSRWYIVGSKIQTDFCGASILGLEVATGTELAIVHNFNLFYRFDSNMSELITEISRDYVNTFGRYPKELKGFQNYLSGQFSGLLGSEINGIYEEPKGIRSQWNNFINDDSIKLYRGLDGETMIISIDTIKVKPYHYAGVGLVNEVHFTFKEMSPTEKYAIFSTEKTGG